MDALFSCIDCLCKQSCTYALSPDTPVQQRIPLEEQPDLLDAPLCSVSVFSSHNSYLQTLQVASAATTEALVRTLAVGARCIELDLFRDVADPSRVFVAHGQEKLPYDILGTSQLSFSDACACIAAAAAVGTDPLFLILEINAHRDVAACDTIAATLRAAFGERIYSAPLRADTPLRALLGKVVVVTGGGVAGSALPPLVCGEWGAELQNAPCTVPLSELAVGRSVTRIYPVGDTLAGLLSMNFDALPALQAGVTFCALNVCTNDAHMRAAAEWFSRSSYIRAAAPAAASN
jgi:hypothetical protein